MKSIARASLLFIVLLAACAPQSVAVPSPIATVTNAPLPTTTPEPTQTLEPKPSSIHVEKIPLDPCARITESKMSSSGNLEVIYVSDESIRIWRADLQAAIPNPAPLDGYELKISSDQHRFIFRRDDGETHEIWLIDVDGQNERRLATVRYQETEARYATDIARSSGVVAHEYDWVPGMDRIFYFVGVAYDLGFSYDRFVLVDLNSGSEISLKLPLDVIRFEFAPDGSQLAVLTETELHVFNTRNGKVQFVIPVSLNNLRYSPDGNYIVVFTDEGILRINAQDGGQQLIPLKYSTFAPVGGDGYIDLSPKFKWIDNSTLVFPSLDDDRRYVVRAFEADPGSWTFKVWNVDLIHGATHPSQTFSGDPSSVVLSPDNNRLAFRNVYAGDVPGDLFLADLKTGEIIETIEDGQFEAWHPDSNQYIYSTGHPKSKGKADNAQYFLGQIGATPTPLDGRVSDVTAWLAAEWIVADCEIIHLR